MADRYGYNMGDTGGPCRRRPIIFVVSMPPDEVIVDGLLTKLFPSEYTVETPMLKDVVAIELIKAIHPNVDDSPFLVVKIAGIGSIQSNDNNLRGAFCLLQHNPDPAVAPITYERGGSDRCACYTHYFDQPTRLHQMRIRLENIDGELATRSTAHHTFMFEIHTLNQPPLPL